MYPAVGAQDAVLRFPSSLLALFCRRRIRSSVPTHIFRKEFVILVREVHLNTCLVTQFQHSAGEVVHASMQHFLSFRRYPANFDSLVRSEFCRVTMAFIHFFDNTFLVERLRRNLVNSLWDRRYSTAFSIWVHCNCSQRYSVTPAKFDLRQCKCGEKWCNFDL